MMPFYTEKQIDEGFLKQEMREIALPSGKTRSVTGSRLMWKHFDFLLDHTDFDGTYIIKNTLESCIDTHLTFDVQFHEIVCFISYHNRYHPVAALLPRLLSSTHPHFDRIN